MGKMRRSNKPDARPSFQFYPDDWLADAGLRMGSFAARGLWIDFGSHSSLWFNFLSTSCHSGQQLCPWTPPTLWTLSRRRAHNQEQILQIRH